MTLAAALDIVRTVSSVAFFVVAAYFLFSSYRQARGPRIVHAASEVFTATVLVGWEDSVVARQLDLTLAQVDELSFATYDAAFREARAPSRTRPSRRREGEADGQPD